MSDLILSSVPPPQANLLIIVYAWRGVELIPGVNEITPNSLGLYDSLG